MAMNPLADPTGTTDAKLELAAQATVDASGLACPLPILRAKKALAQMSKDQVLKVITTDRGAVRDFQAFCQQTGNALLAQETHADCTVHYLRRR